MDNNTVVPPQKNFSEPIQKKWRKEKKEGKKKQQELGDDLSVCMMNILPKVSSLSSLLAVNLTKTKI